MVVGDSGTGKTWIASRLALDSFNDNPGATIGASNISSIWLPQVKECVDPSAIIVICGNKCDRYNEEQVKEEEAKKYAENIGASFIQTSAPRGSGIKEMFSQAGKQYLALLGVGCQEDDNKGKVKLDKKNLKKKKDDKDSCC